MLNDQSSALADEKRVQPINLPILLGLSQTLRDFLRWRCCGKGLTCRHQSCGQSGEHMAAIDFSHFFAPMSALSARASRWQSRMTPRRTPGAEFGPRPPVI